ncbi:MAG: glucose-6-phosphate isomerase family protein [Bacteroidota bacterium]
MVKANLSFDPGVDIAPQEDPLGFNYGREVFGPQVENRSLDSIRKSLRDPECEGPEIVYSIAMDVGKKEHSKELKSRHLLFGVVTYAKGRLGQEPVRSQGHIHAVSRFSNGWSTPEVYEIWHGKAIIYMQELATDDPGRCFAVSANPGDVVIVPPDWAHATISADTRHSLTFGAWCVRDYAFEYDLVRAHRGLAWFPVLDNSDEITWEANLNYMESSLYVKSPSTYESFGIDQNKSIYQNFEEDYSRFDFVVTPGSVKDQWQNFIP